MPSNISGLNSSPGSLGAGGTAGQTREAAGAVPAPAAVDAGSSDVQITASATQLSALVQTLRAQPAVDQARVSELSAAIAGGSYAVQPQRVAAQLMRLEQSLRSLPEG